ncbi:hypothetical protein EBB07_16420 [Paenibacillaceae bacterium]|nr:hypothetical protein EBB07_16420 [Paenibacillaceae bacterium]
MIKILSGIVLLVGAFSAGAAASSNLQEIKAYLNGDLKVRTNGVIAQLNDVNGNAVLPITYKGSTYLPVRGVADLLGVAVDYDQVANEVILGERLDGVAVNQEDFNTTLYSKEPSHTNFGDKDYGEVLYSPAGTNIFTTFFNPEKKYQSLYLQVAAIGENIDYVEIKDLDSNALLRRVDGISTADGMVTIEADIAGASTVVVEVRKSRNGAFVIPLTTSYYK